MKAYGSIALVVSAALLGCGPKSYDDCILDSLRGVTSNLAASEIKQACRAKFPAETKEIKTSDLSKDQLASISLSGRVNTDSSFSASVGFFGKIYNGNQTIDVSEITVRVSSPRTATKTYRETVGVKALTESTVIIKVHNIQDDSTIEIISAKGTIR